MSHEPQPVRKSLSVWNPNDKMDELRRSFANDAKTPSTFTTSREAAQSPSSDLEQKVVDAIRTVFDPEIPVNIYDLGLIYGISINHDNAVDIRMTLTAPGCPVAGAIVAEVERSVENIDEVKSARVTLVWDPPWDKSRMTEAALLELGLL